jgi:hypothetical protein
MGRVVLIDLTINYRAPNQLIDEEVSVSDLSAVATMRDRFSENSSFYLLLNGHLAVKSAREA